MPPEFHPPEDSPETSPEASVGAELPNVPLLDAKVLESGDRTLLNQLAEQGGWLQAGETIAGVSIAGEGNMNLTLRLETDRRTVIVKQSRPWVEKYPQIEAPFDRSLVEECFYRVAARLDGVAEAMPTLIASQPEYRLLVLQDLGAAGDLARLYREKAETALQPADVDQLSRYLRCLHSGSRELIESEGLPERDRGTLLNREMRQLNFQHIFEIPLAPDNGLELDEHEPGLSRVAARMAADQPLVEEVAELGRRYLADGKNLLHGDFFPGSWLETAQGIRVIDPEFAFLGEAEFDYAVAVAHLCMAGQPWSLVEHFLSSADLAAPLVAQFAGVEIIRRLIGVAQLPIPPSDTGPGSGPGRRARLLERARAAVVEKRLEALQS